jgi:hypothetical protein
MLTEAERYLDELDRKTYSNLAVTNPQTGVKNLEIGPIPGGYQVTLRDSNGNTIWGNRPDVGVAGFRMPMPMYPSIPYAGGRTATTSAWVTMWQVLTFVNSAGIQIGYRYGDTAPAGGTSEVRVQYDTGSGPVTMPDSVSSSVNPGNTVIFFSYVWPSDLFDTQVRILLQARIAAGSGAAVASPMYLLGGTS